MRIDLTFMIILLVSFSNLRATANYEFPANQPQHHEPLVQTNFTREIGDTMVRSLTPPRAPPLCFTPPPRLPFRLPRLLAARCSPRQFSFLPPPCGFTRTKTSHFRTMSTVLPHFALAHRRVHQNGYPSPCLGADHTALSLATPYPMWSCMTRNG